MPEMKTLTVLGKTYEIVDEAARTSIEKLETQMENTSSTSVSYEEQSLTDDQQTQARTNIGAISPSEVDSKIANATEERPVDINMSGYDDGLIVLTYADGSTMDVTVTFDDSGNPTKFSTEEFTITWSNDTEATE